MQLFDTHCRQWWLEQLLAVSVVLLGGSWACGQQEQEERPLFVIRADGTGLKQLTKQSDRCYGSPEWSPDGKLIALDWRHVTKDIYETRMSIFRPDGTEVCELGLGAMPSWSPDGTQLVCHTYDNPQAIVVLNVDGSGRETILNHWGSPRWCPKENQIASLRPGGPILLFDLAMGIEKPIFGRRFVPHHNFSISPDGLRFCFGDQQGGVALATLDPESDQATVKWLLREGANYKSSWAPDGKRVVFSWQRQPDAPYQLYVMDVDSGEPPQRLPGQDSAEINCDPDWSPDGESILFVSGVFREPSKD